LLNFRPQLIIFRVPVVQLCW